MHQRAAVVTLHDLVDGDGKELPFTPEILEDLLGRPYVRLAMLEAYSRGLVKSLAGN